MIVVMAVTIIVSCRRLFRLLLLVQPLFILNYNSVMHALFSTMFMFKFLSSLLLFQCYIIINYCHQQQEMMTRSIFYLEFYNNTMLYNKQ
jgi:hypothetical protein